MPEALEIQDFAGIKSASVEIKGFNILIGPQSVGKSVIAKLFFTFKKLLTDFTHSAEQLKSWSEFRRESAEEVLKYFSQSALTSRQSAVKYRSGRLSIALRKDDKGVPNLYFEGADPLRKIYEELLEASEGQPIDPDATRWAS